MHDGAVEVAPNGETMVLSPTMRSDAPPPPMPPVNQPAMAQPQQPAEQPRKKGLFGKFKK